MLSRSLLSCHGSRRLVSSSSSVVPSSLPIPWLAILLVRSLPFLLANTFPRIPLGVIYATSQTGHGVNWLVFTLLQLTVWLTHMATHYWNEYGDYEVDILNKNAGAWTGGSKARFPSFARVFCSL